MANGFEREMPVAKQHEFIRKLIAAGDAQISDKMGGNELMLKGEKTKPFLVSMKPWRGKFIAVRESLAHEYAAVSGLLESSRIPYVSKAGDALTKSSVAGLAEGSTHVANLLSEIFTGLGPSSNPMINALTKSIGRVDLVYTLPRVFFQAFKNNKARMLELGEIGATKEPYHGFAAPVLNRVDEAVRIVSDDIYKGMAEKGWVENTETARREFINQVGNYSKRLQPKLIRMLRETGVQPFVTAVHTFNVMGVRRMGMGSGARSGPRAWANMALKADILGGWIGYAVVVGSLNKLLSGSPTGARGTPLGDIGWTGDDGRTHRFPLGTLTGFSRGLRATGIGGAIESQMLGLPPNEIVRSGAQALGNTALNYVAGPMVRVPFMALTGQSASIPSIQKADPAPPSTDEFTPLKSQMAYNILEAVKEAHPIAGSLGQVYEGVKHGETPGKLASDVAERQLFRYYPHMVSAIKSSERYPQAVHTSDLHRFIEGTIAQIRRAPSEERNERIREAVDQVEPKDRQRTRAELQRRTHHLTP